MSKGENKSPTVTVTVSLSKQVTELLDQIAETGLMGVNRAEVARRFIDDSVLKALANPLLNLKLRNNTK